MNRVDFILSKIKGRVLDVGFSSGTLHKRILGKAGCEVYGIDTETKKQTRYYKKADAEKKIPFKDDYFDSIVAGEVIEHMHNPQVFVKESYRALKDGGIMVITTPNRLSLINRIFKSYYAPLHFTLFSKKELLALLEKEGFSISEFTYIPYTSESCDNSRRPKLFLFRRLLHYVIPNDLREDMVVVCVKQL